MLKRLGTMYCTALASYKDRETSKMADGEAKGDDVSPREAADAQIPSINKRLGMSASVSVLKIFEYWSPIESSLYDGKTVLPTRERTR